MTSHAAERQAHHVASGRPQSPAQPRPLEPARKAIRIRGLTKRYAGNAVVDRLDLTVSSGEFFGILGPNGAGKTTTFRMLLGLTPYDEGEIEVFGASVRDHASDIRARLGVVPQFDTLDVDFTVIENLITYARYFGLRGQALERRTDELLADVQLTDRRDAKVPTLSGGMRRRLTLARALVHDPELIVLDEPTTGLDPQARHHMWRVLRRLHERGRTLILTTHYMDEAETLCDRVAILDGGRVIACDTPQALINHHVEPFVATLFGAERLATSTIDQLRRDASLRLQPIADSIRLYATDPVALTHALTAAGLRATLRPTGLEDVFLRLTGHELRDG
ncbi:MAG: ABC transporter ATP-binding protein [Thioalkalivibrionaceae bacterium]